MNRDSLPGDLIWSIQSLQDARTEVQNSRANCLPGDTQERYLQGMEDGLTVAINTLTMMAASTQMHIVTGKEWPERAESGGDPAG